MQISFHRCCLPLLVLFVMCAQSITADAAVKLDSACLDTLIAHVILEDDVVEAGNGAAPGQPSTHAFYIPGARRCTTGGGYAPAGAPPKAIALYLAYRENHGKIAYCPQPFSPVRIYADDPATGCRPVAAPSANACALKAFTGQGDATIVVAQDSENVTDREFVAFLREYIPLNPNEFPGFTKCMHR